MFKKSIIILFTLSLMACGSDVPENSGKVQTVLFLGTGENQPLIVGLGGSEGGNPWATDQWKATREKFTKAGYAFLALGYFGAQGTPEQLDRISLDAVYNAITEIKKDPKVDDHRIALIGGSKGAEMALLLASYYPDISCVISIVGSHAAFPALTVGASTSSWTFKGKEIPFVPATWSSVPAIMKRDLRRAFTIMMEDTAAVEAARIHVENIRGPILCVSAKQDEMWPSTEMSNLIMEKLDEIKSPYGHEHIMDEGGHTEALDYFDNILEFMKKNYPVTKE